MRHNLQIIDFENKEKFLRNEQMYLGVRVMNDLKNLGTRDLETNPNSTDFLVIVVTSRLPVPKK